MILEVSVIITNIVIIFSPPLLGRLVVVDLGHDGDGEVDVVDAKAMYANMEMPDPSDTSFVIIRI